jgi:tRNA threonylcarbamoyladenosine biosynthesis protein TsaB
MHEVYWGAFSLADGIMRLAGEEMVIAPSGVPLPEGAHWTGAGSGWSSYRGILSERLGTQVAEIAAETACHAQDVAVIAGSLLDRGSDYSVFDALPVYLRNQVTHRP